MGLWSRKLGFHWLKSHRAVVQRLGLLAVLVFVIVHHSYLGGSDAADRTFREWVDSMRSKQQLSSNEFAAYLYRKLKYDVTPDWVDTYTLRSNLLTLPLGPDRGARLDSIDNLTFYESDPRLAWSVLLDHLLNGAQDDREKVSFSWYDWSDFHMFNKLVSLKDVEVNCSFLFDTAFESEKLDAVEKEIDDVLFISDRLKYNDPRWIKATRKKENERKDPVIYSENRCRKHSEEVPKFNLPVEVHELDEQCRPEVFELQARSHLLNHFKNPLSLTIMEGAANTYRISVDPQDRKNIYQSGYLKSFLEHDGFSSEAQRKTKRDVVFDHVSLYESFLKTDVAKRHRIDIPDTDKIPIDDDLVHLTPELFEVNASEIIDELEKIEDATDHDKQYLESLRVSRDTNPALAGKFFTEAANIVQFNGMGYHRDKRFFNGALINDPLEYQLRLNSLIRTWLKFTRSNGLITWLAHGTLYGQLYNGLTFPWDNDFDVQMPIKHLHLMSRYFNQSLIMEDPREGNGKYFLDVGTSITVRTVGNGLNNIDARFIDIDSGLYVDITGLSVSSTPLSDKFKEDCENVLSRFDAKNFANENVLPEKGGNLASMDILELKNYTNSHRDDFTSDQFKKINELARDEIKFQNSQDKPESGYTPNERYWINKEVKAYNCRNNHFATLDLLSPLTNTLFHGVYSLVPRKISTILRNEYAVPEQFGFENYDGKAYLPALHSWFNYNVLKRFANVNSWNANLDRVPSPITKLHFADIKALYKNMLKLGYNDIFTICYNTFNVTSYRYKEREIQYDNRISKNEKFKLLHSLREKFAPKLSSPGKDPSIFNYERRLWRKVGATLGSTVISAIHDAVESDVLDELWERHIKIKERNSELFIIRDNAGNIELDLNDRGAEITEPNSVFETDPF